MAIEKVYTERPRGTAQILIFIGVGFAMGYLLGLQVGRNSVKLPPPGPAQVEGTPEPPKNPRQHGAIAQQVQPPPQEPQQATTEVGQAPQQAAQLPPPPPVPTPDWKHAQQFTFQDFVFTVPPCIFKGKNLHCIFRVTNQGNDQPLQIEAGNVGNVFTHLIDEDGKEYRAASVELGDGSGGYAKKTMPSGIAFLGAVIFANVPPTTTHANLIEVGAMWGSRGFSMDWGQPIQWRNVPIGVYHAPAQEPLPKTLDSQ